MPVRVRINGKPRVPWRINMMPAGHGAFYLYLHGTVREASKTKVGDRVDVELAFDTAYRGGPAALPEWFDEALTKNMKAKAAFAALTPSRQKEIVRYLTALKTSEARERNLQRALGVLSGRPARFMARDWSDGA